MKLAAAQTNPFSENIEANLENHYLLSNKAANYGAKLIVFPEMSLTGYEREKADSLHFLPNDSSLNKLKQISSEKDIYIVAGAPIKMNERLYIGSFIIEPNGSCSIYTKQFLHTGEEKFFDSSFSYNPIIEIEGERISFAICADITNPKHAENAYRSNSSLYIPSIFFTPNGIPEAYQLLSEYAKKFSIHILMSNFCGESYGMQAGGCTAFWNNKGELVTKLDSHTQGLLLVEKTGNTWEALK